MAMKKEDVLVFFMINFKNDSFKHIRKIFEWVRKRQHMEKIAFWKLIELAIEYIESN